MKTNSFASFIAILGILFLLSSCYYDNGEDLYQYVNPDFCDTLDVSYTTFLVPLIERHCINCHKGSLSSGGINLETYTNVLVVVNTGSLLGAVSHEQGFSPMPRGGSKIPTCEIEQLKAWISQGAKNN